jgi:ABC-type transporter Mla MlaB component
MRELVIRGPLERSDLPGLYQRACAALAACPGELLVCDVRGVSADAVAVEALARLALGARRHRCRVELRGSSRELDGLIELAGLQAVFRPRTPTAGRRAGTESAY